MTLLRCGHPGCNYSSARKNNLARHQRTHSGPPSPPATGRNGWVSADSELAGAGVKPYRCDEPGCTYATADASALKRHRYVHTGEKLAVCDHPGCTFKCNVRAVRHSGRGRGPPADRPAVCAAGLLQPRAPQAHPLQHPPLPLRAPGLQLVRPVPTPPPTLR